MAEGDNTSATWVRWGLPIICTVLLALQLLAFNVLSARMDRMEAATTAFMVASVSDRREMSEKLISTIAVNNAQYGYIVEELRALRAKLDKVSP
jgi:hypothetical protein